MTTTLQCVGASSLSLSTPSSYYSTGNRGVGTTGWGACSRIVVEGFDLSGVSADSLVSATLGIYQTIGGQPATFGNATVHRLQRTNAVVAEMCWYRYKTGSDWGTWGAANTTTDIDSANSATYAGDWTEYNLWRDIDVTDQVLDAIALGTEYGCRVSQATETDGTSNYLNFTVSGDNRPRLVLVFAAEVVSASAPSNTTVNVQFSAAIDATTANDESKWTITRDEGGAVPGFTCTLQGDPTVVQIVFDTPLDGHYTIEATNVLDDTGHALNPTADTAYVAVLAGTRRAQGWVF